MPKPSLLIRCRRLWAFLGCEHAEVHCLVLPVTEEGGVRQLFHVHICKACGVCVEMETKPLPGAGGFVLPLSGFQPPPPGSARWN